MEESKKNRVANKIAALVLVGIILITVGVCMYSVPAGIITLGTFALALAVGNAAAERRAHLASKTRE